MNTPVAIRHSTMSRLISLVIANSYFILQSNVFHSPFFLRGRYQDRAAGDSLWHSRKRSSVQSVPFEVFAPIFLTQHSSGTFWQGSKTQRTARGRRFRRWLCCI
jgi:hypothetical protein